MTLSGEGFTELCSMMCPRYVTEGRTNAHLECLSFTLCVSSLSRTSLSSLMCSVNVSE